MIYIIRHGQTEWNKKRVLLGRTDVPLNQKGRKEAEGVREYFHARGVVFDTCYTSPLVRAEETAEIVTGFPKDAIICTDELLEMNYGPYEGADLFNPPKEIRTFFQDFVHNPAPDGMEQLSHVTMRLGAFIEHLPVREGETILLSTHAIAMKGVLEYLTPDSHGSYWNRYVGTCAVYRFEKTADGFTVPEEYFEGYRAG